MNPGRGRSDQEAFGSTRCCRAGRAEFYFEPFCQLAPAVNGWGFFIPNMARFFGQPPKCEVAHTSLPIPLSNIRLIDLSPGGKNGTGARDHSCDGGDRRAIMTWAAPPNPKSASAESIQRSEVIYRPQHLKLY